MRRTTSIAFVAAALAVAAAVPAGASRGGAPEPVRFATYNASLNRFNQGDLLADLLEVEAGVPSGSNAEVIIEIIEIIDADVLLVNEFDFDEDAAALFAELTGYPHHFVAPSNTGVPSGFDLNNSGTVGGPDDAFGFGFFPGQFGMLVLSRFPLGETRTFQRFLWKDMPGALLPDDPATPGPADWYSDDELEVFRLSSKSHWDVEIELSGEQSVHFLVSHPTPPVFDGPEDRNGTRNHDEIRFWADYLLPSRSGYIYDDEGVYGGLTGGASFVIAGDQNSDPFDGDSIPGSAQLLLEHPRVNTKVTPSSEGAVEAAELQGGANDTHLSDPAHDTADFSDTAPGNLRADYVLPSKGLRIVDAGVFWPVSSDPLSALTGTFPFPSSDHRPVWIDLWVPGV